MRNRENRIPKKKKKNQEYKKDYERTKYSKYKMCNIHDVDDEALKILEKISLREMKEN